MMRVLSLFIVSCSIIVTTTDSWHAYDRHKHELLKRNTIHCQRNYTVAHLLRATSGEEDSTHTSPTASSPPEGESALDETCPCYHEATRPYPREFIEKLSLWPNLMTPFDEENGESVYGSQLALDLIWQNQNPSDCKKAQYIISGGWPYGFGSRIHMEGMILALAVHLGRVYLPHPDGDNIFWETKIPFCQQSQHDETLTCFYEKLSKCTIQDALADTAYHDVNGFPFYSMGDFQTTFDSEEGLRHVKEAMSRYKGLNVQLTTGKLPWSGHTWIPHQVHPLMQCSPMKDDFMYYWWRAVSATFITRPNIATRSLISSLHTNEKFYDVKESEECIAMFVRHGDKGIDMKLLEFKEYAAVAEYLWKRGLVPKSYSYLKKNSGNLTDSEEQGDRQHHHHNKDRDRGRRLGQRKLHLRGNRRGRRTLTLDNADSNTEHDSSALTPVSYSHNHSPSHSHSSEGFFDSPHDIPFNGTLFITTEDPKVLEDAEQYGRENHWKIIYTNLFNRLEQTAYKTWDEQHKRGTKAVHDNLEYISMLYNLLLSSQCEAWVCTLASNSCRMMDEIRATIGGKANRHYADISKESCDDIPCVADHGTIKTFGE